MAVSGSNDFNQSEQTIIQDALVLCGGLEDNETPTDEQIVYCRRTLNRMCKSWSKKGLKAWCWREETLPLVVSQTSYTVGPTGNLVTERPLEIANARKVTASGGNNETPVTILSRQGYMDQPNKSDTGEPVSVYYDPQLDNGVLFVWPAPDNTHTIKFSSKQYIENFDAQSNTPYYPVEWLEAIVYGLAWRLCPKYEVSGADRDELRLLANQFLQDAEDGDFEQGSTFLEPELFSGYR